MPERKVIGFIRAKDGAETPVYHDEDLQQKLPHRRVVALKGTRIEGTEYPGPDLPVFEATEPPAEGA